MCRISGLARNSIEAQERMFRLAERDFGLSIRTLHIETGIPKNTLDGWRKGTTMPAWAIGALGAAGVPDYLLSLVLLPFERIVDTEQHGDGTLHEAANEAAGFAAEYLHATDPESDGGPILSPRERARLAERALRAGHKLRAVAK